MKLKALTLYTTILLTILIVAHLHPQNVNAQICTYSIDGEPPALGCYLKDQVIPSLWIVFRTILIAIVFILTITLVFKTATSRDNPDAIAQVRKQWVYLILLVFLAAGAGGTLLGFVFNLFGFAPLDDWLAAVNGALDAWTESVN